MSSAVFLDTPLMCPLCKRHVRELLPLTRYDKKTGRWVATKACLPCCGPPGEENYLLGSQFRRLTIER